jgi:hypothetical protein
MKFKSAAAMMLGMALFSGGLKADDVKVPDWVANTTVRGFVDAYYQYNFNGLAPIGRVFDSTDQSFTVSGAKLSIFNSDSASGTSGDIDLLYGPMAAFYNANSNASSLAIEQAFFTQLLGPVEFKLGKADKFFGFEMMDTSQDFNYSRGILFGKEPMYNTGLMGTYTVMSGISLMGYFGDGNSVDTGVANHPDFGAQIAYTGFKNLSLTGTYYNQPLGPSAYIVTVNPTTVGNLWTNIDMFDFVGSYQVMENLTLAGEYLYQTKAVPSQAASTALTANPGNFSVDRQGYALYVNYKTPVAGLSIDPRFEQFFTPAVGLGLNGSTQENELTLTLKYAQGPLTHFLEFRDDAAPSAIFAPGQDGTQKPVTTQNTLTYGAVYAF